jgi:hypothetical protein
MRPRQQPVKSGVVAADVDHAASREQHEEHIEPVDEEAS